MNILVLGGSGMAGHMLVHYLRKATAYRVDYTTRTPEEGGLVFDARSPFDAEELIEKVRPDVVVNAIGLLNEAARIHEWDAYKINGVLPRQLAKLTEAMGSRVVHISTDCVFSGEKGNYTEADEPDGVSVYARTKMLGELKKSPHLTIRTSIIGPEIRKDGIGLMGWFLSQQGEVPGYTEVLWNGVTTLELAKAVHYYIQKPAAGGLIHLCAPRPISKHDLLLLLQKVFAKEDVMVVPDDRIRLDRTLRSTREDADYLPPDYPQMLEELRDWMRWM